MRERESGYCELPDYAVAPLPPPDTVQKPKTANLGEYRSISLFYKSKFSLTKFTQLPSMFGLLTSTLVLFIINAAIINVFISITAQYLKCNVTEVAIIVTKP